MSSVWSRPRVGVGLAVEEMAMAEGGGGDDGVGRRVRRVAAPAYYRVESGKRVEKYQYLCICKHS